MKWIHHFGVNNIDEMSNVSKALKDRLKGCAEIRAPEVVSSELI
jgi:23S rRNA (adenine2503-C2)-methyltransferase